MYIYNGIQEQCWWLQGKVKFSYDILSQHTSHDFLDAAVSSGFC